MKQKYNHEKTNPIHSRWYLYISAGTDSDIMCRHIYNYTMNILEVTDISYTQQSFTIKDISFSQQQFQKIAITGETGSGKSTLMKIIAGLLQPDTGEILLEGKKVTGPHYNLVPGHKSIGYLSQRFELRNHYRMEELLAYANILTDDAAKRIFALCRIEHLLKRKTEGLSGGEQQRLALARLLLTAPKLLLLDEPFSNLDPIHKNILKSVLNAIGTELGITCILTSHDPLDTLSWADEIIVLRNGSMVQQGSPQEIYRQPANQHVAGLFGSYNILPEELALQLLRIPQPGKKPFIRPEQLRLSEQGVAAIVKRVSFCGRYHELLLDVNGYELLAQTNEYTIHKGQTVYFTLADDEVWYIPGN